MNVTFEDPRGSARFLPAAAFAFAAILFLFRLGGLALVQPDEGRNASIAREMAQNGSWLIPTYNGIPYLDKPAFYFRIVATSLSALGENEFAARLPSALAGLLLLLILFLFVRRFQGRRRAALTVVIAAASPLVLAFARIVILDMLLAVFVSASILAGFLAEEAREGRPLWLLLAAGCAALATLVKGPVGFLTPLLVLLVFHAVDRNGRAILRLFSPANLLLFVLIAGSWFLAVTRRFPDFPHYGLVEETLRRYGTGAFHRTGPAYYYAPVLLAVFFPWSVLLPEAIGIVARGRGRLDRVDRLFIVWALVVVLFFSTSQSKLPGYILTAVVALAALTARLFDRALSLPGGRAGRLTLRGGAILGATCALLALLLGFGLLEPGGLQRLFRIRSREFDRLAPVFVPLFGSLLAVGAAALFAWRRRSVLLCLCAMLLLPVTLLTVCFEGLKGYAEASSSRPLARAIPALPEGTELACIASFPGGVPFYTGRTLFLVSETGRELESNYVLFRAGKDPAWTPRIIQPSVWDRWIDERRQPVFVISGRRGKGVLDATAARAGLTVRELHPGWWGALLPPAGGS